MNTNSYSTFPQQAGVRLLSLLTAVAVLFGFSITDAQAKPKANVNVTVVPTIENIEIVDGKLVASGSVTGTVKGKPFTAPFTDVPVDLALAEDQTGAGACPILDLSLAPINLDVLGLVVQTSDICLKITAYDDEGLLGDLLCAVANLLNGGLSLGDILGDVNLLNSLPSVQALPDIDPQVALVQGIGNLLNAALDNLLGGILTSILDGAGTSCAILHLEVGAVNLNLLGLEVILDNCAGGPVVVDITGERGAGNLLGNLLCGLLGSGGINLGDTLQDLLDGLLGRLPGGR